MTDTLRNAPSGFKLLAWEGVGLFVPQRWEIGRREGDARRGFFRVDSDARIVIQLRWWTATRAVPIGRLIEQHARSVSAPRWGGVPRFRETSEFALPAGRGDISTAFVTEAPAPGCKPSATGEIVIVWQRVAVDRVLMARFLIEGGRPSRDQVRAMLAGLRLQGSSEERDWALHDLALKTAPGYALRAAHVYAGVIHLEFADGRRRLALRRFSAADAVMGTETPRIEDLERWCRRVYAPEFHDMRYRVEPMTDPAGRPGLRLTGSPRLLAPIEMRWLIPKHRRVPRRIDVIWDPAANKIYGVEILRPTPGIEPDVAAFQGSLRLAIDPGVAVEPDATAAPSDDRAVRRTRSLHARVRRGTEVRSRVNEQGRTVLTYTVARPRRLRWLRVLAGLGAGPESTERCTELDLIGSRVWQDCACEPRVCDLIESVHKRFRISFREAELSVTEFIRAMGSRGLLAVVLDDPLARIISHGV